MIEKTIYENSETLQGCPSSGFYILKFFLIFLFKIQKIRDLIGITRLCFIPSHLEKVLFILFFFRLKNNYSKVKAEVEKLI